MKQHPFRPILVATVIFSTAACQTSPTNDGTTEDLRHRHADLAEPPAPTDMAMGSGAPADLSTGGGGAPGGGTSAAKVIAIDPESAPPGATVAVSGSGFSAGDTVQISNATYGTIALATVSLSAGVIWATLPSSVQPGAATVKVQHQGASSNSLSYTVTLGRVFYVATSGSDSNPGTLAQPWKTMEGAQKKLSPGESYPGFFAPVASSVRYVDGCFGRFIDSLKRTGLYDRSIIVVTSDHGDSLGEGGRWGHGFFLYPEVMRVPLIIHLPASLRGRVSVDPNAVAFSTDITPTLYALLGHEPADLGSLFGRPLFGRIDGAARPARPGPFLLASSYGAVYGILRDNGRLLYTADAEDARDFAFDLAADGPAGVQLALTADMTAVNRQLIREQLSALAALNHFTP